MRMILRSLPAIVLLAGCTAPASQPATSPAAANAVAHQAHEAYVAAINTNNLDSILAMLTEDIVSWRRISPCW